MIGRAQISMPFCCKREINKCEESYICGLCHSCKDVIKYERYLMYTVSHPIVVEVSWVLFLDYACWLGQKQNTQNFYHKRMKDGVGA